MKDKKTYDTLNRFLQKFIEEYNEPLINKINSLELKIDSLLSNDFEQENYSENLEDDSLNLHEKKLVIKEAFRQAIIDIDDPKYFFLNPRDTGNKTTSIPRFFNKDYIEYVLGSKSWEDTKYNDSYVFLSCELMIYKNRNPGFQFAFKADSAPPEIVELLDDIFTKKSKTWRSTDLNEIENFNNNLSQEHMKYFFYGLLKSEEFQNWYDRTSLQIVERLETLL